MSGALPQPKKLMPNWALAGLLTGFVAATYLYSMRAVGGDDLGREVGPLAGALLRQGRDRLL